MQPERLQKWKPAEEEVNDARREIWMPPALIEAVASWTGGAAAGTPKAESRYLDTMAFLTDFIAGGRFDVGVGDDRCDLKALTPPPGQDFEVWEMRIIPGEPHTRIFGVFASRQDFVAMSIYQKAGMTSKLQNERAQQAKHAAKGYILQNMISKKTRPFATDLGGIEYGYSDFVGE